MDDLDQRLADLRRLEELQSSKKATEEEGFLSKYVPDRVKNYATAAYKGLGQTFAGALDAQAGSNDFADAVLAASGQPERKLDKTMPFTRKLEETGYQPKTSLEKLENQGIRGLTSALVGGSALQAPVRAAFTGGLAGLGSEGAGQFTAGKPIEPYARLVGALLGGGTGAVLSSRQKNLKDVAQVFAKNLDDEKTMQGMTNMEGSRTLGAPLNFGQAYEGESNAKNIIADIISHRNGAGLQKQLMEQPEKVRAIIPMLNQKFGGVVREPVDLANRAQMAETEMFKGLRGARKEAVDPLFAEAGTLAPDLVENLHRQVLAAAKASPGTNKQKLLSDLASKFVDPAKVDDIAASVKDAEAKAAYANRLVLQAEARVKTAVRNQHPTAEAKSDLAGASFNAARAMKAVETAKAQSPYITNAVKLNNGIQTAIADSKNTNLNSAGADKYAAEALGSTAADVRAQIGEANPAFGKALEKWKELSGPIESAKKSIAGRIAGVSEAQADKEAVDKISGLFARGRDPNSKTSELWNFADTTKTNPEVFSDAFATRLSHVVAKADKVVAGKPSTSIGAEIERELVGDKFKQQGLSDQFAVLESRANVPIGSMAAGYKNALKLLAMTGDRPAVGLPAGVTDDLAKQSLIAKGFSMIGLAPGKPIARGIEGYVSAGTYQKLNDMLMTKEGTAALIKLGREPVMSLKAQGILNTLLGTSAVSKTNSTGIQDSNTVGYQGEQR